MAFPLFPKIPGRAKPAAAKPKPTSKAHRDGSSEGGREKVSAHELAAAVKARGSVSKAARKPEATEPPDSDIGETGLPSLMDWTQGLHQNIHAPETNPILCPVLENAALMHASGQFQQARLLLERGLAEDEETKNSPLAWLALFDLLQRAGERASFDQVAMQYVVAFERSAPAWEDQRALSRPAAKQATQGYVALTGKLSGANTAQISHLRTAAQKQAQIRLDLGALTGADDTGARMLADTLAQLRRRHYPLTLQHPEKIRQALENTVKQGRGAGEGYWILLLELLQWQNDHSVFEDRAVDYAVAFEVSPPSWEPPLSVPAQPAAPAISDRTVSTSSDTLVWNGAMTGATDPQLARLAEFREGQQLFPIDMTAVDRIDFVCAGAFLNAIARAEKRRQTVQIIGASPIIRALLLLIGVSARHFVKKSP